MDAPNETSNEKEELNQVNSKNIFYKLKSNYILQTIFNNFNKKKSLEIVKYNKYNQRRLNLSINDYKEYSSIEIEIIPCKYRYREYKIINYEDKDKLYYHIYFDNNTEEVRRNYLSSYEQIDKIKIIIDYQVKSFNNLFCGCEYIESINFKKFLRKTITNMNHMFTECHSLKELNLTNCNTTNVSDMSHMFYYCRSLKELNLSNFNTENVTDICGMFSKCKSLEILNISNFDINKVTSIACVFEGCESLKEIDLSNFKGDNKVNRYRMFSDCSDEMRKKIKAQLNKDNKPIK